MKKLFSVFSLLFASNILLAQQWVTNGTNINNTNTGNVGIGTTTPAYNLDISSAANTTVQIRSTTVSTGYSNLIFKGSLNQWKISKSPSGTGPNAPATLAFNYDNGVYGGDQSVMSIYWGGSGSGGVVIGTNASTTILGNCALGVNGKIGARELVISNLTPFPDYVFAPGYKLRPLSEIEKFIKQYSRLPEMPSAEDVKRDGLEVGKLTTILVQKVEELTLYIIELKKENEEINRKLQTLSCK